MQKRCKPKCIFTRLVDKRSRVNLEKNLILVLTTFSKHLTSGKILQKNTQKTKLRELNMNLE